MYTWSSQTADHLKAHNFRKRPYVQLGDPTAVPDDESLEANKSSFPSGHTCLGWSVALTLAEMAPDRQDSILERGFQYGQSRQIVGYHWATDIEAARLLASALVARLHADSTYRKLLTQARKEYQRLRR